MISLINFFLISFCQNNIAAKGTTLAAIVKSYLPIKAIAY
jgi:hypothetical protein